MYLCAFCGLLVRVNPQPPSRLQRAMDQQGVDVLCKANGLAVLHSPDVGEVSLEMFAGGFVGAAVLTQSDYNVAGINELVRRRSEPDPFRAEPHKHAFEHSLWTMISPAKWKALGFRPIDLRAQEAEHTEDVAFGKRLVNLLH